MILTRYNITGREITLLHLLGSRYRTSIISQEILQSQDKYDTHDSWDSILDGCCLPRSSIAHTKRMYRNWMHFELHCHWSISSYAVSSRLVSRMSHELRANTYSYFRLLSLPVAFFSIKHWRSFRKTGIHPKLQSQTQLASAPEYPMEHSELPYKAQY